MSRGALRRRFFRTKQPPVLDPVGYRLPAYLVGPPEGSPVSTLDPNPAAALDQPPPAGPPRVKLVMADGTIQGLPEDPETERRAAYLVRSMLSPPPPPPLPPKPSQG